MTTPREIDNYGGVFKDAVPVDDPTTTESATYHNRLTDDVAQGTRTWDRVWVHFQTATSGGAVTPTAGGSMMGVGSGQLPTIARTGAGLYTVTYPTSWTDGVGTLENIVFSDASGDVVSTTTAGRVQVAPTSNVLSVAIFANVAGVDTLSDLAEGVTIRVEAR